MESALAVSQFVRHRVLLTYCYLGSTVVLSGLSGYLLYANARIHEFFPERRVTKVAVIIGGTIGGIVLCQNFSEGLKFLVWITYATVLGAVVAHLYESGERAIVIGMTCTAGIFSLLSTVAFFSPEKIYLRLNVPLNIATAVENFAAIDTYINGTETAEGRFMHRLWLYGGFVLYSVMILFDTQIMVESAKEVFGGMVEARALDPACNAMSLYIDCLNILHRIVDVMCHNH